MMLYTACFPRLQAEERATYASIDFDPAEFAKEVRRVGRRVVGRNDVPRPPNMGEVLLMSEKG